MYSHVYVEITNICNMSCSFCHGHSRPPRRMSLCEFSRILDKLEGHTKYIYYHLMGEPLTHPELPSFISHASEKGFFSVITTNGTLLKKCGDRLIDAGVYKVNVSLHSFEGAIDDSYKDYLDETISFAAKASAAGVIVVLRLWNNGIDEVKNNVAIDYLRSKLDGEWVKNTRGLRIRNKLHLEFGDRFEWPDINASLCGDKFFCYALKDHFGILCDGSVVPCCMDSDGIICLGNIWENDLSDILSSPRAKSMIKGFERHTATEELCRRCSYAQRFV